MAASAPDKGPPLSLVVDAASAARFLVPLDEGTPPPAATAAPIGIPAPDAMGGLSYV